MADVVVVAANVALDPAISSDTGDLIAGEAITQGQPVRISAADSKAYRAQSTTTVDDAAAVGIALNSASTGQPVRYATYGTMDLGVTLTDGAVYVVSETIGGIAPVADLTTGNFLTLLGVGKSDGKLQMMTAAPYASGIAVA